jgi:shikimate kinase
MRVFLIGYMGSGKTRFGMELSVKTGYPFIDTDELFEEKYRISIVDFFEKYNEETFRKLERDLLLETINYPDAIISTGGGTPCFHDNMDFIRKNGISIYLKMDILSLVNRLVVVKKKRPLLKDKPLKDMESYIRGQIAEREIFYNQADFTVDAEKTEVMDVLNLLPDLPQLSNSL